MSVECQAKSLTHEPRVPGPFGAVLLFVTLLIAACGGGSGGGGAGTPLATNAASGAGLLVYSDITGSIVALDMASGEHRRHQIDGSSESVLSVECSRDGSRIAYLKQVFSDNTHRQIVIAGRDAPAAPIIISPLTQGIAWSPDGTQIAFTEGVPQTGPRLWTVDLATGEQKQLATSPGFTGAPRWSPDGSHIAFFVDENGNSELFVVDASASPPTLRMVGGADSNLSDPDWSVDGGSILMVGPDEKQVTQMYTVDLQSGERRKVSSSQTTKGSPRYSPDGRFIAFEGTPMIPSVSLPLSALDNFGVWIMNADGSEERSVTDVAIDASLRGWCLPGPWLDESWVKE